MKSGIYPGVKDPGFYLFRINAAYPIAQVILRCHYLAVCAGCPDGDQVAAVGLRHFDVFLETVGAFAYWADNVVVRSWQLAVGSGQW